LLTRVEVEADDVRRVSLLSNGAGDGHTREGWHEHPWQDHRLRVFVETNKG